MLPAVLNAPIFPTTRPLSSRLSVAYLTRDGVTVPSSSSGKTKIAAQEINAAVTRRFVSMATIRRPETTAITYLPSTGIAAIQRAATISRRYSRAGSGSRSARRPPHTLPRARAIMMTPMMMVQTICDALK